MTRGSRLSGTTLAGAEKDGEDDCRGSGTGPSASRSSQASVPCTLALAFVVFLLYGYTLNRITLFALIFSIGIVVDDAIVVIENIVRHWLYWEGP